MHGPRQAVVDRLAADVPVRRRRGVLVAVDGVDASGKTELGRELVAALRSRGRPAVAVHGDAFLNLRAVRHRQGRDSPRGFWEDSYDLDALRRLVLDPVRRPRPSLCPAATDPVLDRPVEEVWQALEPGGVVVLDALFLHRDELAGRFDLGVFLRVPFAVSVARMAARDGGPPDPDHPRNRRYVEGQRLYLAACDPERRADVVVDNADLAAPVVVDVSRGRAARPSRSTAPRGTGSG